jgi:hypothetical protein
VVVSIAEADAMLRRPCFALTRSNDALTPEEAERSKASPV